MSILKYLNFPRSIKPEDAVGKLDLVIFSDGSKDVYTYTYGRWQKDAGNYDSRLVTLKNCFAPIKVVDIIRLGLSDAATSKRLRSTIETKTRMSFNIVHHILDSEIVKAMINKERCRKVPKLMNGIG